MEDVEQQGRVARSRENLEAFMQIWKRHFPKFYTQEWYIALELAVTKDLVTCSSLEEAMRPFLSEVKTRKILTERMMKACDEGLFVAATVTTAKAGKEHVLEHRWTPTELLQNKLVAVHLEFDRVCERSYRCSG